MANGIRNSIDKFKKGFNNLRANNNSLTRQAIGNSFFSAVTSAVSKIGGLIFAILLARILLPELFGLYNLALSIIMTFGTFADLGINSAFTIYLSKAMALGKKGESEARFNVKFFFKIKFLISLLFALALLFGAGFISNLFGKPLLILPLQIGAIYIFVLSLQGFFAAFFVALKKLQYGMFSEILLQISRIGLFVLFVGMYKNVFSVFLAATLAFSISALFYLIIILAKNKNIIFGTIKELTETRRKEIIHFLSWTSLNTILISFYLVINPLILGFFVETKFIGYFSAIFSIVVPLANLVNIGFVFMPIFTWIQGSRLNRGFNKAVKYLSILSIPAAFGLSFIIISIIRVIYGQEYLPTEYYIPLLVSSILASFLIPAEILNMLIDSIFISKRKVKIITLRLIWATGLLILLDFIFIMLLSRFGAAWIVAGICAATLITRYTVLIISNGLLNKSFNFKLDIKSFLSPLIASLIMLAFLFIFEKLFNPGIGRTIIMVCLAVIVYLISFYLIDNRRNI